MRKFLNKHSRKLLYASLGMIVLFLILLLTFHITYAHRVLPNVYVGNINIGGLKPSEAAKKLKIVNDKILEQGITLVIDSDTEIIRAENIDFNFDIPRTVQAAYAIGHQNKWYNKLIERLIIPLGSINVPAQITFNDQALRGEIDIIGDLVDVPRKDIRLSIQGTNVFILQDTREGQVIDRQYAYQKAVAGLINLENPQINLTLQEDIPRATIASVDVAKKQAENILKQPLVLKYNDQSFYIPPEKIGSWITSNYNDDKLIPGIERKALSAYITDIAVKVNVLPQKPRLVKDGTKIIDFVPPSPGLILNEAKTIDLIAQTLSSRRTASKTTSEINLPMEGVAARFENENLEGVVEMIGKATTPFTGSPRNRIHNIENGIQFLSGLIVKPAEEFSTLGALGKIDNTTGYLPELVIRGDRTTPEFGGGLCQVSTTLFRAVLSAGLPVTARRNHSYRVSYYEKDGAGVFIGPGLDATIYEPDVDFKFKNDTKNPILIYAYTKGDLATFELYGTKDGRTSKVFGPTLLSETSPGEPINIETDTLDKGVKRQVETAHPGGSAIANYTITYPDGKEVKQHFSSYYRRWPARFLIGTR